MTRDAYAHGEFCWVDLVAHEMDAACEFYSGLFGWESVVQDTHGGPPYAMFRKNGRDVAGIGQMSDAMKSAGVPPTWNSYVAVENVDETLGRITPAGGEITVPAMNVLEAGRLAFFRDPTGAHAALWEARRHPGAGAVTEPDTFCWNELATRGAERARAFFTTVLGWSYQDNPHSPTPYSIILRDGQMNGGIMEMTEEWGEAPPHWMVYFAVADIDAAAKRLRALGGSVHFGPFATPVGRMCVVGDPQGEPFQLIQLETEA
jgi:hypothetical protein